MEISTYGKEGKIYRNSIIYELEGKERRSTFEIGTYLDEQLTEEKIVRLMKETDSKFQNKNIEVIANIRERMIFSNFVKESLQDYYDIVSKSLKEYVLNFLKANSKRETTTVRGKDYGKYLFRKGYIGIGSTRLEKCDEPIIFSSQYGWQSGGKSEDIRICLPPYSGRIIVKGNSYSLGKAEIQAYTIWI